MRLTGKVCGYDGALEIPPAVVERLGVGIEELEHLRDVLVRLNTAALAAGALADD